MLKKIYFCLFALFISIQQLFSICEVDEKIYLHPEQIHISENQIFVDFSGELNNIASLYVDTSGVYILASNFEAKSFRTWVCPHCKWTNSWLDRVCQNPDCPTRKKS